MASNLTSQVRNIASVTTAVAKGDLSQKITVDARGEILELKDTVNTMVDQLSSFADRGHPGRPRGRHRGQARRPGPGQGRLGTWQDLTDNVNQLASTLTIQLRAIAEVSTAVTRGDLTQSIAVEAQGEVAELKDNINQMIVTLRDTTKTNAEQGWLDSNLARIGGLLQGQRDLGEVCRMIMTEVTPLVDAQLGAFFLVDNEQAVMRLRLAASYGYVARNHEVTFGPGEGLVGQAAVSRRTIRVRATHDGVLTMRSGLMSMPPERPGRPAGAVRGRDARRDRVRLGRRLLRAAPDVPGAAGRHHRRRAQHDPGQPAHRGTALPVAAAGPRDAGPVGRAAAHQRRAGGQGAAAVASRRATSRRRTGRSSWPGSAWRRRRSSCPGPRRTSRSSSRT